MARQKPRRVSGGLSAPSVPFRIPQNFSALDTLPPQLARYVDHTHYILHTLITHQLHHKQRAEGWIPLNIDKLREVVQPRALGPLMAFLKEVGIVETNNRYIPGVKARGYRLAPHYRGAFIEVPCNNPRFARKLTQRREEEERSNACLPVHHHLIRHLHSITIDPQHVSGIIKETCATGGVEERQRLEATAKAVQNGDRRFTVDGVGRCTTPISSLPRELRPALRVEGESLVAVDVANCQALLLSLLLRQPECSQLPDISVLGGDTLGGEQTGSNFGPFVPYAVHFAPTLRTDLEPDEAEFVHLCQSGGLYSYISGLCGKPVDVVKKQFLTVINGPLCYDTPVARTLASHFPTVWGLVRWCKQGDYGALGRLLMQYESSLIIGRVCGRLMEEHPEMFVATIHDSLLVRPADVATARRVMEEEFGKVGVRPRLREEDHTT